MSNRDRWVTAGLMVPRGIMLALGLIAACVPIQATAQHQSQVQAQVQTQVKAQDQAEPCQPQWLNSVSLQDGTLTLAMAGERFKVESDGQLYYDVHKVRLTALQMGVLADYHQFMRQELPYVLSHSQLVDEGLCRHLVMRRAKEQVVQRQIPALKHWQSVSLPQSER
ncbi:hypothetical protein [Photobacterium atrarenae]|uniref:DUF2884 family protein n=1 Tax=Photobacterium atrarenae TaxID=865757 RepID=A0ABY5GH25_9GAMM|nr:hypothetical protein [Photobacterium atrarenae]UTV28136.1 hypothetical protein NNL38_02180 [Photobacterium atrarenae]